MFADVVVFDPRRIQEHATYEKPNQLSTGVREVFVNGVEVVRDGRHTGAKPGRIVRGPGWHATGEKSGDRQVHRQQEQVMITDARSARIAENTMPLIAACLVALFACLPTPRPRARRAQQSAPSLVGSRMSTTAAGIRAPPCELHRNRYGASAGPDGRYRIGGVRPAVHTASARRIGYAHARQSVTVTRAMRSR